jgi:hypothetical protein
MIKIAQTTPAEKYGLNATATAADVKPAGNADLATRVGQVINGALTLVGIIFLILAIYGGFRILLSRGESGDVKKGRDTIVFAVIGMVIILLSYGLTNFVFTNILK